MLAECKTATVVIKSAQETGTAKNPLPYHIRKKMIQNVYRDNPDYARLRIIAVNDTADLWMWPQNVLAEIAKERQDVSPPDVFFGGMMKDFKCFEGKTPHFRLCDRTSQSFVFLSGSMVRDMIRFGDERWCNFVHEVNFDLIKKNMINL